MIYLFDKELWREGNESVVTTEIDEVALRLEKKSGLFRTKIIVYDRYHVPIGLIEKHKLSTGKMATIYYDEQVMAHLHFKGLPFMRKIEITTPDKLTFKVKGKYKELNYRLLKGKKGVADVSPKYAHRPHQYGMKTEGEKKHRYVYLCSAIALAL